MILAWDSFCFLNCPHGIAVGLESVQEFGATGLAILDFSFLENKCKAILKAC